MKDFLTMFLPASSGAKSLDSLTMTSNARFGTYGFLGTSDSDCNCQSDSDDVLTFCPCPSLANRFEIDKLLERCNDCGRFFAKRCIHKEEEIGCNHHSRIVFTDGACTNNGAHGSVSGIGVAFGETREDYQFFIPVDDRLDPGKRRMNQRAELLAALQGLKKICKCDEEYLLEKMEEHGVDYLDPDSPEIVIATDSEYVAKGMTEWLPRWRVRASVNRIADFDFDLHDFHCKENNLRKSNGQRPANLDLFLDLGAAIVACQYRYGCKVKFWRIDREYNVIADELAKRATHITAGSGGRSGQTTNEFRVHSYVSVF